jgi:cytochrome c peroxidase
MHGQGTFYDPRLIDAARFPVAAANGFADVRAPEDRITGKLAALQVYQLALPVPAPPADHFDAAAAERGRALFEARARCATCHVPPLYTEPGWNMHTPEEIGIDSFQADRSPDGRYRTTPLGGLFTREQGGFYHDGRFATLEDVVDHYDRHFVLGLTAAERAVVVQFLRSL